MARLGMRSRLEQRDGVGEDKGGVECSKQRGDKWGAGDRAQAAEDGRAEDGIQGSEAEG